MSIAYSKIQLVFHASLQELRIPFVAYVKTQLHIDAILRS